MPLTYDYITQTTLTSPASVITLSNISSSYTHLRLEMNLISGNYPLTRFNNDTSANYNNFGIVAGANNTEPSLSWADGVGFLYMNSNGDNGTNFYNPYICDIFSYVNSELKQVYTFMCNNGSTSANLQTELWAGTWNNTAAIQTITITRAASTDFATGTNVQLYGILKA